MGSQYAFYKEVHPSTGITHCVDAFFTAPARKTSAGQATLPNLIVARSNLLQVYRARQGGAAGTARLEVVGEWPLWGIVESLAVLRSRFAGIQRDAVLVTFREAKLVVLDWDEASESIKPSSMHYFERDATLSGGHSAFAHGPRAIADPQGRCAAVIMMNRQVALLSAMDDDKVDAMRRRDSSMTHPQNGLPATLCNAYVLNLNKCGVRQVRDAAFLYRYNEPVLLLLHEAGLDWAGRARRGGKDGMALLALSINIGAKRYPRLWSADRLPSDAMQLMPVRSGGTLVLCQHLVLFYTQGASCSLAVSARAYAGSTPYALEFAEHAEASSTSARRHAEKFATNMHPEAAPAAATGAPRAEGFDLDLCGSASVWLSTSALLLSLASGQLVMLTLQQEGTLVRRLKVVDAGISTSPAASLCRLGAQFTFLASFTGDSFLVHTLPEGMEPSRNPFGQAPKGDESDVGNDADAEPGPAIKRQRTLDLVLQDYGEEEDIEVSLIYRTSETPAAAAAPNASKYKFKVADMLPSIGPVRDLNPAPLAATSRAADSPPDSKAHPLLLAAVGSGKQGSLAVLRRGLVPHLITSVPLQGVRGVWGVRYWPQGLDWEPGFAQHAYLLIAQDNGTRILQAGGGEDDEEGTGELGQLEGPDVGFDTHRTTICAGTLLNDSRIVQVCGAGFKVLAGTSTLQEVAVEVLAPSAAANGVLIASASLCDPYLLLHLSNGTSVLLCANPDTGEVGLVEEAPLALRGGDLNDDDITADASAAARITACAMYCDSAGWLVHHLPFSPVKGNGAIFVAVCRVNGAIELFALPDMARVWAADDVVELPSVLLARDDVSSAVAGLLNQPAGSDLATVVELRIECFAADPTSHATAHHPSCERPLLLLRLSDHTMVVYRAFGGPGQGVRFAKLPLDLSLLSGPATGPVMHRFDGLINAEQELPRARAYSGVFVAGPQPAWLVACRGTLVLHPMNCDGHVVGFTPFHNPNCSHGFITLAASGALRICQLPPWTRLDTPWPLQKVNQGATVRQVAFHPPSQLCVLLVALEAPYRPHLPEEEGGDPHASYAYAAANAAAKHRDTEVAAEVRLVDPGGWRTVWREGLEAGEAPRALHSATLRLSGEQGQVLPTHDTEALLAVGTALAYGEDTPCTGRVVLFRVRPAPEGAAEGLGGPTGELAYSRLVQGPVAGLATIDGSLVVAYGSRIDLYAWSGAKLVRVAFHDAPVEVTCLATIKSFLVYGDAIKGLYFLQVAQGTRQLTQISKDYSNAEVSATGTIVAGGKLGMACGDAGGTLRLFAYSQAHPQMWRGKRLLPLGALHMGHYLTCMASGLRMAGTPVRGAAKGAKGGVLQATLAGTSAGGVVCLAPLADEGPTSALQALQHALVRGQAHAAGLNPRAFRRRHRRIAAELGGGMRAGIPLRDQNILDGDLLWTYMKLPRSRQLSLALGTGATRDELVAMLHDLACSLVFV